MSNIAKKREQISKILFELWMETVLMFCFAT